MEIANLFDLWIVGMIHSLFGMLRNGIRIQYGEYEFDLWIVGMIHSLFGMLRNGIRIQYGEYEFDGPF